MIKLVPLLIVMAASPWPWGDDVSIPATALPSPGAGVKGGVEAKTCSGTDKISSIATDGVPVCSADVGGGAGAPTDAQYITQVCNASLTAEQCMSALGTGIVINTTSTGVPSIYAGGSCGANTFVTSTNASGALTCTQPSFSNISGTATDAQLASSYSGVGSCTNQFVRSTNDNAAPTCAGVAIADHTASGTPSSTTFLRGDNTWATPGGGADPWTYLAVNGGTDFTTSSATAVDVTGLSLTPSANTKYEFECKLLLRTATTTVNPRVGFAWSTGLTDGAAQITESQAATGTPLFASGNPNAALLVAVGGLPNTTQSWPATIAATIAAGASPSGATRVQLATETAGTNVTIKAVGSFCRYRTYT